MKVSLNTVKQFVDIDVSVDELVKKINEQLGGVEEVVDLAAKYKDVVIVKVVACEKHPNADKLSVCMIDDNGAVQGVERDEHGLVRVVCGAPNVHADMFAAWLPPKSTVPATYNDAEPFVLDARELRGIKSNGMLAAADELALGSDHDGIIEITEADVPESKIESLKSGANFAELFGLDDTIIDIENKMFTHRPDCFGQLGVAREIFAILQPAAATDKPTETHFNDPDWYWMVARFSEASGLDLTVFNDTPDKVSRFMAVALKNVTIAPSPLWLQCKLVALGSKPINNVVDATNYIMLMTAQPTHAYDYDKIRGHKLGTRMAEDGEKVTLLNDKIYDLTKDDIVIVDGEGIVGLGGVMGGGNSEVTAETKNVVLEVATFDMYTVRKTGMRHGLFTEALTRFSKGQSTLQNGRVLAELMRMIPGEQASQVFDLPDKSGQLDETSVHGSMRISPEFINERLGVQFTPHQIGNILRFVRFATYPPEDDKSVLEITAPYWRTDIVDKEDIVEEVGRLYGFDKLPVELPKRTITPAAKNPVFELKKGIRANLSRFGVNEVVTYSFVHENTLKKAGQDKVLAFQLSNAISPDLQYYRLSLTPSLLDKIHPNIKLGHDEFALFEIGKAHVKGFENEDGLPLEFSRLALVYTSKKTKEGAAYYRAKRLLESTLLKLGVARLDFEPLDPNDADTASVYYEPKHAAKIMVGDVLLGRIGEYRQSVVSGFKLSEYTAGFEISLDALSGLVKAQGYQPLSRFPKVTQDISLKVSVSTNYADVFWTAWDAIAAEQPGECDAKLEPLSIYQPEDDKDHKTITLRLSIASYEKTLTDKDVSRIMDKVAEQAKITSDAERI